MLNKQAGIGDLVYIPSEALMTDYKTFIRTEKPTNVICLGHRGPEVKVFYQGSLWWINKSLVYSIKE